MSIVTSLFNNFWSEIWFISIWSASVSCNLSLSYPLHFIKIYSTVLGRSHLTDSCFPILYNEWLSAVCDIMLSSFLFPKILLSFPTVFWILYKCRPFSSPSHLLCHIYFNAYLINPFISNLLIGTLNSISGCFNVFFSLFDPPLHFLLFLYVQVNVKVCCRAYSMFVTGVVYVFVIMLCLFILEYYT